MFTTLFTQPLYNSLVALMAALPFLDAGVVVIIFTVIVKTALFPLSKKAIKSQTELKAIEPELASLRQKHKDDRQALAMATMELYRSKDINPFSGIAVVLIQLPIIFALYFVFARTGLPAINQDLLYSFVPAPAVVDMNFLGLIDITTRSVLFAVIAGVTMFLQMKLSAPLPVGERTGTFQDELARTMSFQMRYVMPAMVFFASLAIPGVVSLYWATSNVFTIFQEWTFRRKGLRPPFPRQ
jgi:YidC/Oxa1 family membrane protein insertase